MRCANKSNAIGHFLFSFKNHIINPSVDTYTELISRISLEMPGQSVGRRQSPCVAINLASKLLEECDPSEWGERGGRHSESPRWVVSGRTFQGQTKPEREKNSRRSTLGVRAASRYQSVTHTRFATVDLPVSYHSHIPLSLASSWRICEKKIKSDNYQLELQKKIHQNRCQQKHTIDELSAELKTTRVFAFLSALIFNPDTEWHSMLLSSRRFCLQIIHFRIDSWLISGTLRPPRSSDF